MAILDSVPGIEVLIYVDGRPLQEYRAPPDDDEDDSEQVTQYVVAQPGKKFSVHVRRSLDCKFGAPMWDLNARMMLDGKPANGRFLYKDRIEECRVLDGISRETSPGKWTKQKFTFSNIEIDSDGVALPSATQIISAKSLGEIHISLLRGTVGENRSEWRGPSTPWVEPGKVHEKALKGRAVSHKSSLAAAEPSHRHFHKHFTPYDFESKARYIFRYRSEADLKAEMIIPRSSPTPLPLEDRPRDSLTRAELLELLSRHEAAGLVKTESQCSVKRERKSIIRDNNEDEDSDEVEIVEPPVKRPRVTETIDLT